VFVDDVSMTRFCDVLIAMMTKKKELHFGEKERRRFVCFVLCRVDEKNTRKRRTVVFFGALCSLDWIHASTHHDSVVIQKQVDEEKCVCQCHVVSVSLCVWHESPRGEGEKKAYGIFT
jgi:hypothetical protein